MNVIGVTGTFGSGCSFISKNYIIPHEYKYLSLSDFLRQKYTELNPGTPTPDRSALQNFGNQLRKDSGSNCLVLMAISEIDKDTTSNYVVDSIRNINEVIALKQTFSNFYLLGVNAEQENRWTRVKPLYNDDKRVFDQDEQRDREEDLPNGQQVTKCFERSDYIIINNSRIMTGNTQDDLMKQKVDRFLQLVNKNTNLTPNKEETAMAIAHAASHQSSCLKRKVGAIIRDSSGSVFASGYNEVPPKSETCKAKCGVCYRAFLRQQYKDDIGPIIEDESKTNDVYQKFKDNVKLMDYCRALHAEENAILSVVRNGASSAVNKATLFTTTYPCNLCANKIAEIGIKTVYYAAPYPMKEAKETFIAADVNCIAFEGITYLGYFRMEGTFL